MNCLTRIYVKNLWGAITIDWKISDQVIVLAGGNGTGKSTVLRSAAYVIRDGKVIPRYENLFDEIVVDRVGLRRVEANFFEFKDSQIVKSDLFCDLIDDAFVGSGKRIVREGDGLKFVLRNGFVLSFDHLSSGEAELVKLYARAVGMGEGDLYILDEPETSLHIDWQENLLDNLLRLGAGMQIVASTHSPSIVLNGWMANIIQIENLVR